tara:strand:+ start:224 stop:733 length:510 start_codon:yes stop_codon:yes gene_type:complete
MKRFLFWPLITAVALVTGCSNQNEYEAGIRCALDGPGELGSPWPENRKAAIRCLDWIIKSREQAVTAHYLFPDSPFIGSHETELYLLDQMEATGWRGSFESPVESRHMKDHLKDAWRQLSMPDAKKLIKSFDNASPEARESFTSDLRAAAKEMNLELQIELQNISPRIN